MKQAELARIWGVSPAYVCKLVGRGMPLASLEEADLWRVENLEKPPRSESGGAVVRGLCEVLGSDEEGLMEDTIEARGGRREVDMEVAGACHKVAGTLTWGGGGL